MSFSFDGPVLITTTKNIRKKSPIKCNEGDQGAHLVGLNLLKHIFNYYSVERDIVVPESVITQLIEDVNDVENFSCETPEENTVDKYTENDLLGFLFHGTKGYNDLNDAAKTMYIRLRQMLQNMINHLHGESITELSLIQGEISGNVFPLPRHCQTCKLECHFLEEMGSMKPFCGVECQFEHYGGQ